MSPNAGLLALVGLAVVCASCRSLDGNAAAQARHVLLASARRGIHLDAYIDESKFSIETLRAHLTALTGEELILPVESTDFLIVVEGAEGYTSFGFSETHWSLNGIQYHYAKGVDKTPYSYLLSIARDNPPVNSQKGGETEEGGWKKRKSKEDEKSGGNP